MLLLQCFALPRQVRVSIADRPVAFKRLVKIEERLDAAKAGGAEREHNREKCERIT